ncbi:major outer membrane protein [Aliarcobacter cryaerophilus]|uniref:major outer membrane protein n=1 Tax=Aliarcobacter cryaerophilus TaxID=28198 RepID=UPI00112F477C|nr:major outer membrane protein [Aliarcobacter cryaerophilus]
MRKISKISLVAAVAVAGFSTANAQPLEEAIKNVDVSGSVVYRYDNFHNKEKEDAINGVTSGRQNTDANRYKIGLNLSSKVNDYVKFNSRFIVGSQANGGFASLNAGKENTWRNGFQDNTAGADGQADVSLSNAYFGFTAIPNTVVNIGKQGLTTPYTVATDINGNEQTGTGILALTTVGPVTAGLGYFNNSNLNNSSEINLSQGLGLVGNFYNVNRPVLLDQRTWEFDPQGANGLVNGGSDIYVATVQGDLDFVKLEAWYLGAQETFNSYTLAATSTLDLAENAKIGLEARYVNLKLTNDARTGIANGVNNAFNNHPVFGATGYGANLTADDFESKNDMFRLAVDGKFSIVNARLAYTKTGKNGGLTALDQDAKNTSLGWAITSNGVANADYIQAALGADILDNLNFTLHYGQLKSKEDANATKIRILTEDIKAKEVYGQLTYKMSKNLSTYLRYGTYDEKINSTGEKVQDQTRGRIQVAYTF